MTLELETFWVNKGDVRLAVYRRHDPASATPDRPVLFLVHGSSVGALTSFDLHVPGKRDYSFMAYFAERGYDVWTLDHEGYGQSSRTASNADIACGVADLEAAMPLVEEVTGQARFAVYGQSSGALKAAVFTERNPDRVDRLILDAFVWTGEGAPTLIKRRERLDEWRSSPVRKIDRAMIESIFSRDKAGLAEDGVAQAIADVELKYGDTVPTGTYLDMCAHLPVADPANIHCPVLILRGEHDGIATEDDVLAYFRRLATPDKQIAILPAMTHVGPAGVNRYRFWHLCLAFLSMPPRLDRDAG